MLAMAPVATSSTSSSLPTGRGQNHAYESFDVAPISSPHRLKSHKPLPRPATDSLHDPQLRLRTPEAKDPLLDSTSSVASTITASSQSSSPRTLKHKSQRLGNRPDLPPTPPTQSRTSSGSRSAVHTTPALVESARHLSQPKSRRPPITPPDQKSPPTPDVTPPQHITSIKATLRPSAAERSVAGTTPSASRTESFTTAREEQLSSEDEMAKASVSRYLNSTHTSQTTILRAPETADHRTVPPQALDQALNRLDQDVDGTDTRGTAPDFDRFDGQWTSDSEWRRDQRREYDQDTRRPQVITSRKKRQEARPSRTSVPPAATSGTPEVVEHHTIATTPAAKAARIMHVKDNVVLDPSPISSSRPSISDTSASMDARRSSGTSTHSSISPVVEVILLGAPPQRQRTLRHVKKQYALRDVIAASNRSVSELDPLPRRLPHGTQRQGRLPQRDSQRSQSIPRPISSSRARREIWNSGAIPVVVVPDRRSSHVSSKEPSLRSTSSRRSRRTMSLDSSTEDILRKEPPISGSHQARHSRRASDSTPRDERTIDFPPAIPPRSSSLSAPTSRNGSRAGSLTTESIHARQALLREDPPATEPKLLQSPQPVVEVDRSPRPSNPQSTPAKEDGANDHLLDPLDSPMKFSSRNTPFSIASVDTAGTAPQVSEAFAIQMFAHQNSSLLMVNHSNKPSDASDATTEKAEDPVLLPPAIVTSGPADEFPVTPPGQHAALVDADSPLRNPRAPPQPPSNPPAINLIPATPSRSTPAPALDRGRQPASYFDHGNDRPSRRPSLLRRAFSRRRHSIDQTPSEERPTGFLKRTFSLSRQVGRASVDLVRPKANNFDPEWAPTYSRSETEPSEQHKLHPFWRPQGEYEVCEYGPECPHHRPRTGESSSPRHGPNSRPPMVKRTLSSRMKQTFAILPARPHDLDVPFGIDATPEPERRTIRRTNSGNLRVMKRKSSSESLNRTQSLYAPQQMPQRRVQRASFWRTPDQRPATRRFSISDKFDELQQIPHKMNQKKREKRSEELRKMISAPTEVRDNMGEVIRYPHGTRAAF